MTKNFFTDLQNERSWGVSSNKKVPLFMSDFLITNDPSDIRPVTRNDMDNLPTLIQLDANESLTNTNRAYHMHAKDNLIVAFDIEVRSDPQYIQNFLQEPAPYKEWSKHKGIHMFYKLDRKYLTTQALQVLGVRAEYKFKGEYKGKSLEYELMMNNHWLTVTRDVINQNIKDETPKWVYDLINSTSESYLYAENKQIDLGQGASKLAHLIADNLFDDDTVNECLDLSVSDFENDDSTYEYNIALKLLGALKYRVAHFNFVDSMNFKDYIIHDKDLIWATALKERDIIPERSKHNTYRDGVPFLVYEIKRANDWLSMNDEQRRSYILKRQEQKRKLNESKS